MKRSMKVAGRRRSSSGAAKAKQDDKNGFAPDDQKTSEELHDCILMANLVADRPGKPEKKCQQKPSTSTTAVSTSESSGQEIIGVAVPTTTRCSGRLLKRVRRDISPPTSPVKKAKEEKVVTPAPKQRRTWDLWSSQDADLFFEGLYQYGKNFEEILKYIMQRYKRKGDTASVRNKDQVRHFYYRTWHKISKYIKMGDNVKKKTQELYGLINYSELRKKFKGRLDEKVGQKLNELIHKGYVVVKWKNKNLKLKTPSCRALKMLNNIEEPKEDEELHPKIPSKVTIELVPRNNKMWTSIQNLAQNPRIRIHMSTERKLGSIINFLQKKWKMKGAKIKESAKIPLDESESKILKLYPARDSPVVSVMLKKRPVPTKHNLAFQHHQENPVHAALAVTNKCSMDVSEKPREQATLNNQVHVETGEVIDDRWSYDGENVAMLKSFADACMGQITPRKKPRLDYAKTDTTSNDEMMEVSVKTSPGESIKMNCYEDNLLSGSPSQNIGFSGLISNSGITTLCADYAGVAAAAAGNTGKNPMDQLLMCESAASQLIENQIHSEQRLKSQQSTAISSDNCGCVIAGTSQSGVPPNTLVRDLDVPNLASLSENVSNDDDSCDKDEVAPKTVRVTDDRDVETEKPQSVIKNCRDDDDFEKRVRDGWTFEDAQKITIAELHLTMGCPEKIVLDYEWVEATSDVTGAKNLATMLSRLVQIACIEFTDLKKSKQPPLTSSPCHCHCKKNNARTPPNKFRSSPMRLDSPTASNASPSPVQKKRRGKTSEKPKENFEIPVLPKPTMNPPTIIPSALPAMKEPLPPNPDSILWKRSKRNTRAVRKPMVISNPRNILPKAAAIQPQLMTAVNILPSQQPQRRARGSFVPIMPNPSARTVTQSGSLPPRAMLTARQIVPGPVHQVTTASQQGVIKISPGSYNRKISTTLSSSVQPVTLCGTQPAIGANKIPNQSESLITLTSSSPSPSSLATHSPGPSQPLPQIHTQTQAIDIKAISASSAETLELHNIKIQPPDTQSRDSFNVSTFLDVSLPPPCHDESTNQATSSMSDKLIEIALGTAGIDFSSIRGKSPPRQEGMKTPIGSPFKTVNTDAWLNNEIGDFTLGLFDSPVKKPLDSSSVISFNGSSLLGDNSRDSINLKLDVDTQLQCMMVENSVDYVAKFQELAAQIEAAEKKSDST
ncbi:protein cramped-like isoform X2 [Tubulanus polymorphus]|uniref:protein cramped-like isoform X2 n=1 Tax=Tubulanus polymorphus TaxID=672921 RepID=UPI003DA49FCC